jgi:hypothetical protein
MRRSHLITEFDENGRALIGIPMPTGEMAELYKDDYTFLIRLGLSPNWSFTNQYVMAPCYRAPGRLIGVGRVLADATPGTYVRYRDRNKLNLRSENLELLLGGGATRRDRDYLDPNSRGAADRHAFQELYRKIMGEPLDRTKAISSSGRYSSYE